MFLSGMVIDYSTTGNSLSLSLCVGGELTFLDPPLFFGNSEIVKEWIDIFMQDKYPNLSLPK